MTAHVCPVGDCDELVRADRLMCPADWRRVPKPLQDSVHAAWDGGRGAGTIAHVRACQAAIRAAESAPEVTP